MTESLYRVAQEALANVSKHAQASSVHIDLLRPDAGRLMLRVRDDGRGLTIGDDDKDGSFGLIGMRERVALVGGTLRVISTPDEGTVVEAEVPTIG